MSQTFAYIGKWEHDLGECPLGFQIFFYDIRTGALAPVGCSEETRIMVGAVCLDEKRGVLYCTDESENLPGMTGGGGRILAFALDKESGSMKLLSACPSYGVRASGLTVDKEGEYLIVTNHAGRKPITKTVRDCFGDLRLITEYDEANTVLFRLRGDGGVEAAVDVFRHTITGALPSQNNPHPHQVAMSPDGSLFMVCDKGGDTIYVFSIDREKERLVLKGAAPYRDLPGSSPRYGVFHPKRQYYFMNHETKPVVHAFFYHEDGTLERIDTQDILPEGFVMPEGVPTNKVAESSDLKLHPNGKWLYNIVRGLDIVTVYEIQEETGMLVKLQTQKLIREGEKGGSRGCAISPDGRFLLITLLGCDRVISMPIYDDGTLGEAVSVCENIHAPAGIAFWTVREE